MPASSDASAGAHVPDLLERAEEAAFKEWSKAKANRLRAEAELVERPNVKHYREVELAKRKERGKRRELTLAMERRWGVA